MIMMMMNDDDDDDDDDFDDDYVMRCDVMCVGIRSVSRSCRWKQPSL